MIHHDPTKKQKKKHILLVHYVAQGETELLDYIQRVRHNMVENHVPVCVCVSCRFLLCGVVCDVTLTSSANIQLDPHPKCYTFCPMMEQTQRSLLFFRATLYCLFM